MQWRVGLLVLILLLAMPLCAAELYVAPRGDDANPGTRDAPLRTLAAARDAVRASVGKEAVTVNVADGVYYLADTLVLTPEDSGAKDAPVTYRAENEGKAVLSGGIRLKLDWIPYRDGILQAATPAGMKFDQLFVDGVRKPMARYPNYDASKTTAAYQGFAADAFSNERAARWADPTGGYIHAMHRSRWGGYHYRITGKDRNGKVQYEGGWQNNRRMGMHEDFRMVENIFEELDAPGEWFHDAEGGLLYYMPAPGDDLGNAQVEVVRLGRIVEVQGSAATPVRHITLQGFVVRHAARTFMKTNEPLLRSDWAIHRGGAYLVIGGEDINVLDTEFDQVGGNAIFFSGYNRRIRVKGCHIHDVGASGVCFVGDPDAVRDPLFEYRQKNDLSTIDRTPGPKSDNYPSQGLVEDCLIHGIGRVERQPAGVQIAMAMEITVRDTSIYDCARAGINIGDGCWGGHLIERCDVFDTVLETHDHGSFNSWGRDRYWHSDRSVSQVAVDAEPNLPLLDAVETTVIRDSRWRCDHGWDIDLDDGSSNYDIYNNLMLNGGLKLREGFCRRVWNNVTVNNGFHPHVWYNHSRDEVFSNIFMAAHRGARMPSEVAKGKRIDSNLFFVTDPRIKDRFTQFGWDANSVVADPQFVDPANGDFRVSERSPALEIGFRNFPMTQFGVKKPALRAIARTPVIPDLEPGSGKSGRRTSDATSAPAVFFWLGARLQDLKGEEYSAFGTRKEDGGVVLAELPPNSAAALQGMIENDLVQIVNGRRVTSIRQLLGVAAKLGRVPLMVQLVRNQQSMSVEVIPSLEVRVIGSANADDMTFPHDASIRVRAISANLRTANQPLGALIDGHLSDNFGPVFPNSVVGGAYKLNLGELKRVGAIRTCSFNKGGNRGAQKLTLYGSRSQKDPGWDLSNRNRFTPIGSVDTTGDAPTTFVSSVVAAPPAHPLGEFRWIVWRVSPVTVAGENTAFQEFSVEVAE